MIHFNSETRTFNLLLRTSYYAFQVDHADQVVHIGWGPRPVDAVPDDLIGGTTRYRPYESAVSFITQFRPDEVLTFGDVTSYQVTLKASFASLPLPLTEGEAPHLPIRDLRLRYVDHEVVTNAQPGLSPTPGLPVQNSAPRETLRVRLKDPVQNFFVTLCYRVTPEHDIIERWCELENAGMDTVSFEVCNFASLHLPNGTNELTYVSGTWAREFTTHRQRLSPGTHILDSRNLQTGH